MQNKIRNYIREIAQVLNDEALFHKRDIPGDTDDYESTFSDPSQARHTLYVCINEMISAYDSLDEQNCTNQMQEAIENLKVAVDELKMKM